MDKRKFAELCLAKAKDIYDDAEVFVQASNSSSIELYNGALEEFNIADSNGAQLKVRSGNKWATAYTEQITEESVPYLLESVAAALEVAEENPEMSLYSKEEGEELLPLPERKAFEFDADKIIEFLTSLTNKANELSQEIRMANASLSYQAGHTILLNTKGLDREAKGNLAFTYIYVVLARGEEMKSDMAFRTLTNLEEVDEIDLAREAIDKAAAAYGAKSTKAGKYRVVLENATFSSLIAASLSMAFSAESVQKGMSLLAGKIGEPIASEVFNLYDDPASEHAFVARNFDDEGVPCQKLPLIENGVLKNYFYNIETAKKDGVESTGNASKSYKSKGSPGPSCLSLVPGDKSWDELLQEVGNGLIITDLQGLHSGLDPISGDFSLPANGFLIEDGKQGRAVNQITIAGNIIDFLKNISVIGADIKLNLNGTYIPSVIVDNVAVSGDEE